MEEISVSEICMRRSLSASVNINYSICVRPTIMYVAFVSIENLLEYGRLGPNLARSGWSQAIIDLWLRDWQEIDFESENGSDYQFCKLKVAKLLPFSIFPLFRARAKKLNSVMKLAILFKAAFYLKTIEGQRSQSQLLIVI